MIVPLVSYFKLEILTFLTFVVFFLFDMFSLKARFLTKKITSAVKSETCFSREVIGKYLGKILNKNLITGSCKFVQNVKLR